MFDYKKNEKEEIGGDQIEGKIVVEVQDDQVVTLPRTVISRAVAAKIFAKQVGPYSLAGVAFVGGSYICTVMLADLGKETLAAAPFMESILAFLTNTFGGMTNSIVIQVGESVGRKDYSNVGKVFKQSLVYSALLSIPAVTIILCSKDILISLGQAPDLINKAQEFFLSFAPSLSATMLFKAQSQLALGVGKPNIVLLSTAINSFVTPGLTYLFMFGKCGFPKMGVAGFGVGYSISVWSCVMGLFGYFRLNKDFRKYELYKNDFRGTGGILKQLFKVGVPIGIQLSFETLGLLGATVIIGWLGTDSLLAQQIVQRYSYWVLALTFNAAQGTCAIVSRASGEQKYLDARRLGNTGLVLSTGFNVLVITAFCLTPRLLCSAFIDVDDPANSQLISKVSSLFVVQGVSMTLDTVRNISAGGLRGFSDTNAAMWSGIFSVAVFLFGGYALGVSADLGVDGVFWARAIGIGGAAGVLFKRWWSKSSQAAVNNSLILDEKTKPSSGHNRFSRNRFSFFSCCRNRRNITGEETPLLSVNSGADDSLSRWDSTIAGLKKYFK